MPPNLRGFFMVSSYYPSECHADYFDFERIEALKPAIEACDFCTLSLFSKVEDGIRDLIVTGVQTCVLFFSSRRRHTRSDRDWSSDVCSSDLRVKPRMAFSAVVFPAPLRPISPTIRPCWTWISTRSSAATVP